jgi:hypothetical protein
MGLYIRKGFNFGPFRLNLSRSGLGASFGVKGARIGIGRRGTYIHVGRGGLYYRQVLNPTSARPQSQVPEVPESTRGDNSLQEIKSASADTLVDGSAAELLRELNRVKKRVELFPIAAVVGGLLLLLLAIPLLERGDSQGERGSEARLQQHTPEQALPTQTQPMPRRPHPRQTKVTAGSKAQRHKSEGDQIAAHEQEQLRPVPQRPPDKAERSLGSTGSVTWWMWGMALVAATATAFWARHNDVTHGTVILSYSLDTEAGRQFSKLTTTFRGLAACQLVCSVDAAGRTGDWKRHAGSSTLVERTGIQPGFSQPPKVECNISVPTLKAGSKSLYFFPDRLLVYDSSGVGAVPYPNLQTQTADSRFVEDGYAPSDARQVGTTWQYVNKRGGPDRRFNNNRQLPVMLYGNLALSSGSGLKVLLQCSRTKVAADMAIAIEGMKRSHTDNNGVNVQAELVPAGAHLPICTVERPDAVALFAEESDKARTLVLQLGKFWEFLLTEELLKSKLAVLEQDCDKPEEGLPLLQKTFFNDQDCLAWLHNKLDELSAIIKQIAACAEQELPAAWGKPGESGAAVCILKVVNKIIAGCRAFLDWELEVSSANLPANFSRFGPALRGISTELLGPVKHMADEIGQIPEGVRMGKREFSIRLAFSAPPQIAMLNAELKKASNNLP